MKAALLGFGLGALLVALRVAWDLIVEAGARPLTELDEWYDTTSFDPYVEELVR